MARRKSEISKQAEKAVKKSHPATIALAVLFLLIGIIAGIFLSVKLTENDKFVLNGEKVVRLSLGESYAEQGATVVSFGKDVSAKVVRGGDLDVLDTNMEGIYQIKYTVDDLRWGEYQLVRVIIVGDPAGAEEFIDG